MSDEDIISTPLTRRRLLAGAASVSAAAGVVAFMPKVVRDAIADVASGNGPGPFDVSKVKHIVFVMQENRSFDHYFGAMSGLRGFSDPNALVFPNGRTASTNRIRRTRLVTSCRSTSTRTPLQRSHCRR